MRPVLERNERWILYASPALVAACSLIGLIQLPMAFGHVWAANLWGDLAFFFGSLWAIRNTFRYRIRFGLALPFYAAALHAVVYAVSSMFMLPALNFDWSWAVGFFMPYPGVMFWGYTFLVGWPGLLVHALVAFALATRKAQPAEVDRGKDGRTTLGLTSNPPSAGEPNRALPTAQKRAKRKPPSRQRKSSGVVK